MLRKIVSNESCELIYAHIDKNEVTCTNSRKKVIMSPDLND